MPASCAGAFKPRFHARQRLGLDRRIGVGIPDLEFLRQADKGDAVFEAGMLDHGVGKTHPALIVGDQQLGARDHRGRFVVMAGREKRILGGKPRMQRLDHLLAEGFQRRFGKTGADIDALGVLCGEDMAIGRGDADPTLAVE